MGDLQENWKKDSVGRRGHQTVVDTFTLDTDCTPPRRQLCRGLRDSRPTKFPQWRAHLERGPEGNTPGCVVRIQSPQPLKNAVHRTSLRLTPFLPLQKGLLLSRPHKAELRINDSTFESAWQMLVITIRSPLLARIKSDGAVFSRFPQLLLRVGFATTSREFLKRA